MKKISYWASVHTAPARMLIAVAQILLILLSLHLGIQLFYADVFLPIWIKYVAAVLSMVLFVTYPVRRRYYRRKLHDFGFMILLSAMLVAWYHETLSNLGHELDHPEAKAVFMVNQDRGQAEVEEPSGIFKRIRAKQRKFRRGIVKQKRERIQYESRDTDRAGGIALIVLGIVLLALVVMILSCAISCGGLSNQGVVILILGLAGGIALIASGLKILKPTPSEPPRGG